MWAQWLAVINTTVDKQWGFIKGGEFLDHLSNYQLLNKSSDQWNSFVNITKHRLIKTR
jgi:hypothetical protein